MSTYAIILNKDSKNPKLEQWCRNFTKEYAVKLISCDSLEGTQEIIREQISHGHSLTLILVGTDLENPVASVRRLHEECPLAHLVFLTEGSDELLAQQISSPVAQIGSYWCMLDINNDSQFSNLHTIIKTAKKRNKLRTMLVEIGNELGSVPMSDISTLQRYTVSVRFLANVIENAHDAIIAMTTDGVIVRWNNAAQKLFNISHEDAIGMHIRRISGGDWEKKTSLYISALLQSGELYSEHEIACLKNAQQYFYVDLMLSLIRDYTKRVIGISAIVRDVTRRKMLEQRIHQSQKMESLGILAGGVAHHFNNLLATILGYSELALAESPTAPFDEYFKYIQEAADRAAEISKKMLAYAGKNFFHFQVVEINALINDLKSRLFDATPRNIHIEFKLENNIPAIEADEVQLPQVITSLVSNAVESIGSGNGNITITTGVLECDKQFLDTAFFTNKLEEGIYAYFEIADNGCGIEKEKQNQIFDPFYSTKLTGRGLSLAVVQRIVYGHHGTLKIHSEINRGTAITVLLPIYKYSNGKKHDKV